jgi:hypothetical protein
MVDTPAQRRAAAGLFAGVGSGAYDTRTPGVGFALPIPAPTVQPIDPSTHLWTPVWYQWLLSLSRAIGTSALAVTLRYGRDASATMADPGLGELRWNNATQALATKLALSTTDGETPPVRRRLRRLWMRVLIGDHIIIQSNSNDDFQDWRIDAVTDHTTWVELDVVPITSSGGNITGSLDVILTRG